MTAIDEAREAEARMTPGPWSLYLSRHAHGERRAAFVCHAVTGETIAVCDDDDRTDESRPDHDAAGIVAIRNAWPAAMAALDEARREVSRLTGEVDRLRQGGPT